MVLGNGWVKVLRRQILAFCGIRDLRVMYFSTVRGAKPEALAKMVEAAPGILGWGMVCPGYRGHFPALSKMMVAKSFTVKCRHPESPCGSGTKPSLTCGQNRKNWL